MARSLLRSGFPKSRSSSTGLMGAWEKIPQAIFATWCSETFQERLRRGPTFASLVPSFQPTRTPGCTVTRARRVRLACAYAPAIQNACEGKRSVTVQPGVRVGWNDGTNEANVGPRLNLSWK